MNVSDCIAFGSLAVSVVTAIGSYVSYRKHGRKLNEQQAQINEYIIAKQGEEELKRRSADLKFKIASNRLIVKNNGQAEAKDIELTFPSEALIRPKEFPVKIKSIAAGAIFSVELFRAQTILKAIDVYFSWIDGRGVRQSDKRHVSLD